jgi:hypothetical protein
MVQIAPEALLSSMNDDVYDHSPVLEKRNTT